MTPDAIATMAKVTETLGGDLDGPVQRSVRSLFLFKLREPSGVMSQAVNSVIMP